MNKPLAIENVMECAEPLNKLVPPGGVSGRLPAKTDAIRMARILNIHCQRSVKTETLKWYTERLDKLQKELAALDSKMDEELRS